MELQWCTNKQSDFVTIRLSVCNVVIGVLDIIYVTAISEYIFKLNQLD